MLSTSSSNLIVSARKCIMYIYIVSDLLKDSLKFDPIAYEFTCSNKVN